MSRSTAVSTVAALAIGLVVGSGECRSCERQALVGPVVRGLSRDPAKQSSANPKAPPFSQLAAEPSITEYSLRAFLRTPHWTMPNFVLQPDADDDVISYIMSLKARP